MESNLEPPFPITDEDFIAFLDRALTNMIERRDVNLGPGERGRLYGWYWGYYGRAAIDMYRTTQDRRYSLLIERTIEALLEERDDQLLKLDDDRGVIFPGWGTRYATGERSNEITTVGLITLPMVEYAEISGKSWIRDAAVETLKAFRDERRDAGEGRYYFEHRTQHIVEALNHAALYGAALAKASRLIDDRWISETADGIYRYMLSFLDQRGDGICWPYAPAPGDNRKALPSEALWKAAATIELPVALAENGDETAVDLLRSVARSLRTHPSVQNGELPHFLGHDMPQSVDVKRTSAGLTSFLGAFLQIDDLALRGAIFTLMKNHPHQFPNGWRGGSRSMSMAWGHLRRLGVV